MLDTLSAWLDAHALISLFLSSFVSSTLLPGGSEGLLMLLAARGAASVPLMIAAAGIGNTAGAMTSWWIGRALPSRGADRRACRWLRRWGAPALLLSWLPVVGDAIPLAAGWLGLGFARTLLWTAAGKFGRYMLLAWTAQALF